MSPPQRKNVARISEVQGINVDTRYNLMKVWRLQGGVVPASD